MFQKTRKNMYKSIMRQMALIVALCMAFTSVIPAQYAYAQTPISINLPVPGTFITTSSSFTPVIVRGLTIHPENPLEFDFIIDTGHTNLSEESFNDEALRLIKYFLASLTVPEGDMWVNLSPYEKDRIIPESFGVTEMGIDLLSQDYMLKQLTASMMYPEDELGAKFWKRIKQAAYERYGVSDIPVDAFNKVWIVPDRAVVYEHQGSVFVVERHLKVMLEEDYLAAQKSDQWSVISDQSKNTTTEHRTQATQVIREIIIPAIETEVNEGKNFANLRQIYNSMILATWYKKNLKESLLGQVYVDQNKVRGIDIADKETKLKIYNQYIEAFKKGVYDYIKEDYDAEAQQIVARKYFSGGAVAVDAGNLIELTGTPEQQTPSVQAAVNNPVGSDRNVTWRAIEEANESEITQAKQSFTQKQDLKDAATLAENLEKSLQKIDVKARVPVLQAMIRGLSDVILTEFYMATETTGLVLVKRGSLGLITSEAEKKGIEIVGKAIASSFKGLRYVDGGYTVGLTYKRVLGPFGNPLNNDLWLEKLAGKILPQLIKQVQHERLKVLKHLTSIEDATDALLLAYPSARKIVSVDETLGFVLGGYEEMSWLTGDVNATPEGSDKELSEASISERIFGKKHTEFNRTAVGIMTLLWVINGDYESFTAAQNESVRLTRESFNELRRFTTSILQNDLEALDALIIYTVINDLGKIKSVVEEVKRRSQLDEIDHDKILTVVLEQYPGLAPSFNQLSDNYKEMIRNGMRANFNFSQLVQGENVAASLEGLGDLDQKSLDFYMLHVLYDIAGAAGHVKENGSLIITEPTYQNFKKGIAAISKMGEGALAEEAYDYYLALKAEEYNLDINDPTQRAVTRLSAMLRLSDEEKAKEVLKVFETLTPNEQAILEKELNISGIEDGYATLLYYAPATLANAVKALTDSGETEAFKKGVDIVLRTFARVFQKARIALKDREGNGVFTVEVSELAQATKNPFDLNKLAVSLEMIGDDAKAKISNPISIDVNRFLRMNNLSELPGQTIVPIGIGGGSDVIQAAMAGKLLKASGKNIPAVISVRTTKTGSQGATGKTGEERTVQNHSGEIVEGVFQIGPETTGSGRFLENIPADELSVYLVMDAQDGTLAERIQAVIDHVGGVDTVLSVDTGGDALYSVGNDEIAEAKATPDQDLRVLRALSEINTPVITAEIATGVDSPDNAEDVLARAEAKFFKPSTEQSRDVLTAYQEWEMDGSNSGLEKGRYGKTPFSWQAALNGNRGWHSVPLPTNIVLDSKNPWDPFINLSDSTEGVFFMRLEDHLAAIDSAALVEPISYDTSRRTRRVQITENIAFEIGKFKDWEIKLRNLNIDATKDADITLMHSIKTEDDVVQVMLIMDNLRHYGAKNIHLIIPEWKTLLEGDQYLLTILKQFADQISSVDSTEGAQERRYEDPVDITNKIEQVEPFIKKDLPLKIDRIYYLNAQFVMNVDEITERDVDGLPELSLNNGATVSDAWAFILDDITATGGTLKSANHILHNDIGVDRKRILNGVVHGALSSGLTPFASNAVEDGKLPPAKLFAMETLILPEEQDNFYRVPIGQLGRYAIERIIGSDLDSDHASLMFNNKYANKPTLAVFDAHGTLLKSTWKEEIAYVYTQLSGRSESEGLQWVEDNIVSEIVRTKEDVVRAEIIRRLHNAVGEEKHKIERLMKEARELYLLERAPEALPDAENMLRALKELNVPIFIITGSKRKIIVEQLKKAGLLKYIASENIIGRDDMLRSIEKSNGTEHRTNAIESIAKLHPDYRMIHFDDWVSGLPILEKFDALSFGVPQGTAGEFLRNKDILVKNGVDVILEGWKDWKRVVATLEIDKDRQNVNSIIPIEDAKAREIPVMLPAKREGGLALHISISKDLKTLTYSEVIDDSKVYKNDGTINYENLELREIATFPSNYLVSPNKFFEYPYFVDGQDVLTDSQRQLIKKLWVQDKRYTEYQGVTSTWDKEVDKNVWSTNIDTVFLHKVLEESGLLDGNLKEVIEVGVGGGHIATFLSGRIDGLEQISITDISSYALRTSLHNILAHAQKTGKMPKNIKTYLGKGIKTIDTNRADLIIENPPYIPAPAWEGGDSRDPYRGTGLIRETLKEGLNKLNPDNPEASIVMNISSLAQKDFDAYLEEFGDQYIIERIGEPLRVPLKLRAQLMSDEWKQWLVKEHGLEYYPEFEEYGEPYWHTLNAYRLKRNPNYAVPVKSNMPKTRIAMAQINPSVGDISGNRLKIIEKIRNAKRGEADIVVFPELSLTGYPPEDLVNNPSFIHENIEARDSIIPYTQGITALVGFIDKNKEGGKPYNAVAIMKNGKLIGVYHKKDLPTYDVFDELRYFIPGATNQVFDLDGLDMCVGICEDIWNTTPERATLNINLSASPYSVNKLDVRERLLQKRVRETGSFIVYTNLVGGQDALVFDGGSFIVDSDEHIIARGKQLQEDLVFADLDLGWDNPHVQDRLEIVHQMPERLSEMEEMYEAVVLGLRDYVRKTGFKKVILGVSGGIDSALTAAIAAEALGPENVVGVSMPTNFNIDRSKSDARILAENLGIKFYEIPIQKAVERDEDLLAEYIEGFKEKGRDTTEENMQARQRGKILMAIANKFRYLVLSTSNKSESAVGYTTLYGDMSGAIAPIADVPKLKVFALSRYVNERNGREIIPVTTIEAGPSAELSDDQLDSDSLPEYDLLDPILEAYLEKQETVAQMSKKWDPEVVKDVVKKVNINEFKRRQASPGIRITTRTFADRGDRRMPIVNRYRERATKRVGIFGGTFNPPHSGHLSGARDMKEQYNLDEIIFIPTHIPSDKNIEGGITPEQRLEMTKMTVGQEKGFRVSDIEIKRQGTSYTIDTVRELQDRYGADTEFFVIVGKDREKTLPDWKESEELQRISNVVVINYESDIPDSIDEAEIEALSVGRISSTYLRDLFKRGLSQETLDYLHPDVVDYIKEKGLYQSDEASLQNEEVGIVFGKFAPFHNGHEMLIREALNQSDKVIVLLYDHPELMPNVSSEEMSAMIKSIIGDERLEVRVAYDSPPSGDTMEDRRAHNEYMRSQLGNIKVAKVFNNEWYGKHIAEALEAELIQVDPQRTQNNISATAIRKNPEAHKEHVHPLVYERVKDARMNPYTVEQMRFKEVIDAGFVDRPMSEEEKAELRNRIRSRNPIYTDADKLTGMMKWDLGEYNRMHVPSIVSNIENREMFSRHSNMRILDMPIRMPGQGWNIPKELEQFKEVIQAAVEHERAINPDFDEHYYMYFTVDQKIVEPYRTQRRQGWHGDAFVTPETDQLVDAEGNPITVITDNTYVIADDLPTIFLPGPFSLDGIDATDDPLVLQTFNERAGELMAQGEKPFSFDPYTLVRMTPYDMHSVAINNTDRTIKRTFLKIQFSRSRFNMAGNFMNPNFNYSDWSTWIPRNPNMRNNRNSLVDWERPDAENFQIINPYKVDFSKDLTDMPWAEPEVFWAKKIEGVYAEDAIPGEILETVVNGEVVSMNIAQKGDKKITTSQGDQYFLNPAKFKSRYLETPDENGIYMPTEKPIRMVKLNRAVRMVAPWGMWQYVPAGSVLAQMDERDVYLIHKNNYEASYVKTDRYGNRVDLAVLNFDPSKKTFETTEVQIQQKRLRELNPQQSPEKLLTVKQWDPQEFRKEQLPVIIGKIKDKTRFSRRADKPIRVLDKPVYIPGQGWKLTEDLEQFEEEIRMAYEAEQLVNPEVDQRFVHVTVDQKIVYVDTTQRRPGLHGDARLVDENGEQLDITMKNSEVIKQMQGKSDHTYIVHSALPTRFFPGPFDLNSDQTFEDQAEGMRPKVYSNNTMLRLNAFDIHESVINRTGSPIYRTFLKIQFTEGLLDRPNNTINEHFDYDLARAVSKEKNPQETIMAENSEDLSRTQSTRALVEANGVFQNVDWKIPEEMDLEEIVDQVTFVLDVDETLTPSSSSDISDENVEQIVRAARLKRDNPDKKISFILITGSAYNKFAVSSYAPKVGEWGIKGKLFRPISDIESVKQSMRENFHVFDDLNLSEMRAYPFDDLSIRERVIDKLEVRLKEEGLIDFMPNIKIKSVQGYETVTFDEMGQSQFSVEIDPLKIFTKEEQLGLAKAMAQIYLSKLQEKTGRDYQPFIDRIKAAESFIDINEQKKGIDSIFKEAMKGTSVHFWALNGELALINGKNAPDAVDTESMEEELRQFIQENDIFRKELKLYILADSVHGATVHLSDKADVIEEMVLQGEYVVAAGNGLNDTFLFRRANKKMIPVFVGKSDKVSSYSDVIVARDNAGNDGVLFKGTQHLLTTVLDAVEQDLTWGDVQFLNNQISPNEVRDQLDLAAITDAAALKTVGGINLDAAFLDLQIKRDGNGIPLPISEQPISTMQIDGFVPVIINITPISVPLLLSGVPAQEQNNDSGYHSDFDPVAYREKFYIKENI